MAINSLDVASTRRISLGLFAAAGALFLTAVNLAGSATISGNTALTSELAKCTPSLATALLASLVAFVWAELAGHPETPKSGHPHSRENYLQSAFALLIVVGLGSLCVGGYLLAKAVGLWQ